MAGESKRACSDIVLLDMYRNILNLGNFSNWPRRVKIRISASLFQTHISLYSSLFFFVLDYFSLFHFLTYETFSLFYSQCLGWLSHNRLSAYWPIMRSPNCWLFTMWIASYILYSSFDHFIDLWILTLNSQPLQNRLLLLAIVICDKYCQSTVVLWICQ